MLTADIVKSILAKRNTADVPSVLTISECAVSLHYADALLEALKKEGGE